jgi:RHS repeat-associated protein
MGWSEMYNFSIFKQENNTGADAVTFICWNVFAKSYPFNFLWYFHLYNMVALFFIQKEDKSREQTDGMKGRVDTYQFNYDGLGNRVSKIVNTSETRYIVDPRGSNVLAETDASGNITAYYVYGLGLISKITPSGQTYYYHYDGTGSTIAITDSAGSIVNKYAYDTFGKVLGQTEAISNPFKYVGKYGVMDDGNGLLYMRARYYDPEVGRFINKDPIGFLGGDLNLYAYVGNNPLNYNDPKGLFFDCTKCWYYKRKFEKALAECRSELAACKTWEDEIEFMEKYGGGFESTALWNCAINKTGDPKIWREISEHCFKCGYMNFPHPPAPPSIPLPKGF